ncbi:cytochrome c oxidase assembly protein [Nocardioides sp. KIGAM211]|uniref:Cytochrome c oxidase assembly protein n=1 Tax=Nocardioides luti TaxID=2761101 RepID=A0A7X0VBW4_9ACTN|nr:cytochrome c oxidase assembly protein [Nocardioides luti]MBB6629126.1 cytochrome c oxidase assembly protein [Nocardioides luti]
MPSTLPPFSWHALLHTWHAQPAWTAFAAVALAAYVAGLVTCRRHGVRSVNAGRVACFVAGLVVLVLTVSSAIDVYAMALFWDHMVEHLLLIMVVPALLVLGHPLTVLRAAAETRGRADRVDRVLRSAPVAFVTHPAVGVAVYAGTIVGTHLTGFMDAMAQSSWLMGAEQVLYVGSGYLFLLTLIGYEPIRWRVSNLARVALVLLAMTPDTVVGIVLLQTDTDLFPVMEGAHPAWAPTPVHDLNIGGGLMWAAGDGLMMVLGIVVIIALISDQAQQSVLGSRLESIRRRTLAGQVARGDDSQAPLADDIDVDDDDAMLDAYNQMLARLNRPS